MSNTHVQYHYSRRLRLASIEGERLRFCPTDRDRELEECRLRAVERNFGLGRDIERERELERETSELLDRDLLRPRFASLERARLRLRLLPLELESESESESEEEEVLSDLESESELDDLDCFFPLSLSSIANLPISFFAASSRSRSLSLRILSESPFLLKNSSGTSTLGPPACFPPRTPLNLLGFSNICVRLGRVLYGTVAALQLYV